MFVLTKFNKDSTDRLKKDVPKVENQETEELLENEEVARSGHIQMNDSTHSKKTLRECELPSTTITALLPTNTAGFCVKMETGILDHIRVIPVSGVT